MGKEKKRPGHGFGVRLRHLRTRRALSVDQLSEQTGLKADYLERLENQEEIPSVSTILQISRALSLDAGDFLKPDEQDAKERKRAETYEKRTRSYAYKTLSPGAHKKHLKAFLVTIDPRQDHEKVGYRHEGEEFVYVLRGQVEIRVGGKSHSLRRGGTLHFDSIKPHTLRNPSDEKTELIVVLYTP
ncbi:MAG: XRE family transcriptional regulator [bacterium]